MLLVIFEYFSCCAVALYSYCAASLSGELNKAGNRASELAVKTFVLGINILPILLAASESLL